MSVLAGLFDELPDLHGAACTGHPYPDLFFPEHRNNMAREAKEVCASCPVRAACKASARDRREPFGVWGSETEQERLAAVKPPAPPVKSAPTPDWRCGSQAGYSRHRRRNEEFCDPCRLANNAVRQEERERARQSA